MEAFSLEEAQNRLDELVQDALQGKAVYIQLNDQQRVQLVPLPTKRQARKMGSARNQIKISPDFDVPLSDFDEYMK